MPLFMKTLNNISRCQAMYHKKKLSVNDFCPNHYSFTLAICRHPGYPQDKLAKELCLDKSTVARTLAYLEKNDYIIRTPNEKDKRQSLVYPSEKMLAVCPLIRDVNTEWSDRITEGISSEKLNVFYEVLSHIESNAKNILTEMEETT